MWSSLIFASLFIYRCDSKFIQTKITEDFYEILGIFDQDADTERRAFNESMRNANVDELRLKPSILTPSKHNSYFVWKELCGMKKIRPIAIFGPQNSISDGAVLDQCIRSEIPHIQATWKVSENEISDDEEGDFDEDIDLMETITEEPEQVENETVTFKPISINFYPHSDDISIAYARLLHYYNWENFAILYEDVNGLLRIQKIMAEHTTKFPVTVRKLDPEGNNHKIFKELGLFQESRILIDCRVENILKYMEEAKELDMVNHYQHYIFTTLDGSILADKLTAYQSNMTWLSITDYDKIKDSQHYLALRVGKWINDTPMGGPPVSSLKTQELIMDDVAQHVLKAFKETMNLDESRSRPNVHPCNSDEIKWSTGALLQDQILKTESIGVTGNIKFDEFGRRISYTLNINEIYVSKLEIIGKWFADTKDLIIDSKRSQESINTQLTSKHFIIISRKAKPYFYNKSPGTLLKDTDSTENSAEDEESEEDDEKYEGFSVDLVKDIFHIMKTEMGLNYTYSFSDTEHETYGKLNPNTKKWDGLIGDLLSKKADLAVCDLTVTEERKTVVDFSVSFMSLGISILFTQKEKSAPGIFSFLNPYSFEVWIYTLTAYCVVSIILFICSRISPADWENPQPCNKEPEELENIWNFKNCAWLTMGSIMTQGCDILPKAIGSRWVCGMWWFFAMIVCQTYIAQLAASLTSALENEPINSVEDLAKQNKILYGAIEGGSTLEFFKNSKDKMYQKIYQNMITNPVVLVKNNDEAEKRVLKGNNKYAFFMESCTIEYKLRRNCNLQQIGDKLDSKEYAIAMPANSPFRTQINSAILRLKEQTRLDSIKKKWWEQAYGAKICEEVKDTDENNDLDMENLIGAFLVLIVGIVICLFITAAEFMNEIRNIVVREKVSHKEALTKELRASLNFFQLQKPVLRNLSRAPSIQSEDSLQSEKRENRKNLRSAAITNFLDGEKFNE